MVSGLLLTDCSEVIGSNHVESMTYKEKPLDGLSGFGISPEAGFVSAAIHQDVDPFDDAVEPLPDLLFSLAEASLTLDLGVTVDPLLENVSGVVTVGELVSYCGLRFDRPVAGRGEPTAVQSGEHDRILSRFGCVGRNSGVCRSRSGRLDPILQHAGDNPSRRHSWLI